MADTMERMDKGILGIMYVCQIQKISAVNTIMKKYMLSEDAINSRIDVLVRDDLINKDRMTLTQKGRDSLRVVLTGGVFDIIHPGHIHTLNAAKKMGDVLVVVVATDTTAVRMKKRDPLHSQTQRQELVNSLSMADLCLIGDKDDIFNTVKKVMPQIIALGYDQTHQERFITDGCKKINLDARVKRLVSPIPESSSSKIQKEYGESIHGI